MESASFWLCCRCASVKNVICVYVCVRHTWAWNTHVNGSWHTSKWIHTYDWGMSHEWMSDMFEFIYMCLHSFTCVSGLMTCLNTNTYEWSNEWVMCLNSFICVCIHLHACQDLWHTWIQTHMNEVKRTQTHVTEVCHTNEWMIWIQKHLTEVKWIQTHIIEVCHTNECFFLYIYTKVYDWSMWFKYKWFEYKHIWLR